MFYKLLGMVTWRAIKSYARQNVPTKAVAAVTVAVGIAVVTAITAAAKRHDEAE